MQRLSDEAVRLIRSTAAITDVCDIVMALFDNTDADCLEGYSTVVKVTNIFASQPVRQHIVSDTAKKLIDNIRSRLQVRSLAYPNVAMQMFKSPSTTSVFSLSSTSSLNQRLAQIYGPAIARLLDFTTLEYEGYRLRGSISRTPVLGRIQHIFVDGCLLNSPELTSTIRSVLGASDYISYSDQDKVDIRIPVADNPWKSSMCAAYRQLPLDIASLEVIGQADSKFIMCKERSQGGWLVAIDQHAADERIRLEASYTELNHVLYEISVLSSEQPVTMVEGISVLVPPATATMSTHNAGILSGLNGRLRMLGIRVSVPGLAAVNIPAESGELEVQVLCVPSALAPRLAKSKSGSDGFAKELLVSVASWFGENQDALLPRQNWPSPSSSRIRPPPPTQPCLEDELSSLDDAWPMLVGVPTVILDTLKSVSCRGKMK
ncbi:hypothetical protein GGI15_003307 [Coemansia interrupta]|uniref:MutL C-terminal dimerisation domain-containing protein n=1 Tax=Coemansia interrupta TaxID=1126814 RepID=A0A9W8HEZ5_9FUNG|nr:hypothetical protein GGI15_003307 [Coemansia interrupta]